MTDYDSDFRERMPIHHAEHAPNGESMVPTALPADELFSTPQRAISTLVLTGPSPCDGCHKFDWCSRHNVACRDFLHWVSTGRIQKTWRSPDNITYLKIFKEEA